MNTLHDVRLVTFFVSTVVYLPGSRRVLSETSPKRRVAPLLSVGGEKCGAYSVPISRECCSERDICGGRKLRAARSSLEYYRLLPLRSIVSAF